MTCDEIIKKVEDMSVRRRLHWRDDQKLRHFSQRLANIDDDVVFRALISFFETDAYVNEGYDQQDIAGTLLALRRPKPSWELSTLLSTVSSNYDLSIEQLPWYLALHYGRDEFRSNVREAMKDTSLTEKDLRALNTFLYWTGLSLEDIQKKLESAKD